MRLFIAIPADNTLKNALIAAQNRLRAQGYKGNYTAVANLHLTLAFIGEYRDPVRVAEVLKTLRFEPFELRLGNIGSFGDLLWCGVEGGDALAGAVSQLKTALKQAGIPFDPKPFVPHITLLRKTSTAAGTRPPVNLPVSPVMTVRRIVLMNSERGAGGVVYTELDGVNAAG